MTWELRAITHEGNDMVLRRFETKEEAEAHPVKLSLWKSVRVQRTVGGGAKPTPTLRLPWSVHEPFGRFTYLYDGGGHRIATLHGPLEQRDRIVAILVSHGLVAP